MSQGDDTSVKNDPDAVQRHSIIRSNLLKQPAPLSITENMGDTLRYFKDRFNDYCAMTDFDKLSNLAKIATLKGFLSQDVWKVYNTFTEAQKSSVTSIFEALEAHFLGKSNLSLARFKFNKRSQSENESFDEFLVDIKTLCAKCDFCSTCIDSLMMDKIVIGIFDNSTREELLRHQYNGLSNQTSQLEFVINLCKAREQAASQNKVVSQPSYVNAVSKRPSSWSKRGEDANNKGRKCKFCGGSHVFQKNLCPANGKICSKCKSTGHFARVCSNFKGNNAGSQRDEPKYSFNKKSSRSYSNRTNKVSHIGNEVDVSDDCQVYNISCYKNEKHDCSHDTRGVTDKFRAKTNNFDVFNIAHPSNLKRHVKGRMLTNNELVDFQIDTGSAVNILPIRFVEQREAIKNADCLLKTWNNTRYAPIGSVVQTVVNPRNGGRYRCNFIVCDDRFSAILGLNTCMKMKLIQINDANFETVHKVELDAFSQVFDPNSLGSFQGDYSFKLVEGAVPHIMPSRRVPIKLREEIKKELDSLCQLGVIKPVNEPSPWQSQCTIVRKSNGKIRICLDPRPLNKVLIRERFQLRTLDEILHELCESTIFSKFDLNHAYWHVKLDEESSKLTCFETSEGSFRFLRLPFGLSISSEIFAKKLSQSLVGLKGVIHIADDILIFGKDQAEHDANLNNFLHRCRDENIRLNRDKTCLNSDTVKFMGHIIHKGKLSVDSSKVEAIRNFPAPQNVSQLRSFLGMVNFIGKFIPNLSDVLYPLYNLTKKDVTYTWSESQSEAFEKIKSLIAQYTELAIFDDKSPIVVQNDASLTGLGSVLLQNDRPIAFASRTLTDAEKNYAMIELECQAVIFGLTKFHNYLYGRKFKVVTDHKPLTYIFLKQLDKAPKRLRNMILKTQDYDFDLVYEKGTNIPIADALSRGPIPNDMNVNALRDHVSNLNNSDLFISDLEVIKQESFKDETLKLLRNTVLEGFPNDRKQLDPKIRNYWAFRAELGLEGDMLVKGSQIVIPVSLQKAVKHLLHEAHQGINATLRLARQHVYWPGMATEIRQLCESCHVCRTFDSAKPKPLLYPTDIPERPWQKVNIDLFELNGRNYLITVDSYSNFFEFDYLPSTETKVILSKLRQHFSRYGLPDEIRSDNGRNLVSQEFENFCRKKNIKHTTSSPYHPQSNGKAESAVKTAKKILKKALFEKEDPFAAILHYRNTPREGMTYSPSELLIGRKTKTDLPTTGSLLKRSGINTEKAIQELEEKKEKMVKYHDKKHNREPEDFKAETAVYVKPSFGTTWKKGKIIKKAKDSTRSYIVEDDETKTQRRQNETYLKEHRSSEDDSRSPRSPPSPLPTSMKTPSPTAGSQPSSPSSSAWYTPTSSAESSQPGTPTSEKKPSSKFGRRYKFRFQL